LEAWRGFDLLNVSWSVVFCSCNECEIQKTWMDGMEVVGGIYSPNHYSSRCCRWRTEQDIVQCPVRATSVPRWGLERLTVEALCSVAAPVSLVAHRACLVRSDFLFCLLTAHYTPSTVDHWRRLSLLCWLTGHVWCMRAPRGGVNR
jgi:hypothetical protein